MPLEFEPRSDEAVRRAQYCGSGEWTDDTLGAILASGFSDAPQQVVSFRSEVRPWRGTYGEVADFSARVAAGLRARGVGPGDPVAFQAPNWMETASTFWALAILGAVPVPIVHFYGTKETEFILRQSKAKILISADRFGAIDFLANLDHLRPKLTDLEQIFIIGDGVPGYAESFSVLTDSDPIDGPQSADPGGPALVAYTSGTTADPKGVIHSHRSIGFEIRQLSALSANGGRPLLVGAPVGHGIGMLAALLLPIYGRNAIHLIDQWNPERVLAAMIEDGVASGSGSTVFLTSLLDHPEFTSEHAELMTFIGLGGSPVPTAIGERAEAVGVSTVRSYGSTEHPSISGSRHSDDRFKRLTSDGRLMAGVEIELRDEQGRSVSAGEPGEIWSKGPDCFLAYTDADLTREAIDDKGFFDTGDIGVFDSDGYLSIVDRKKDVIIRGGENISAAEVENILLHLPGVAEVAVVAAPDERLGEHGYAFIRMVPSGGDAPSLAAVQEHLKNNGLAKPKWPEEVGEIDEFPRTPSGKVQKFVLRERLRERPA